MIVSAHRALLAALADNASIEAFNSRFRRACLNEHWFLSLVPPATGR